MRVLNVIPSMDPKTGGPADYIRGLASLLISRGHVVHVASGDDPKAEFLKKEETQVFALGPSVTSYELYTGLVPWIRQNLQNYDVVVIHSIWQYGMIPVSKIAKSLDIPYFVFVHGMLDPYFNRISKLKTLKKKLYWPFLYPVLRDAVALIFAAKKEMELARQSFKPYTVGEAVIRCAIREPNYPTDEANAAFDRSYPFLERKKYLLFLGRLHPKKGCELTFHGIKSLAQAGEPCHLVIAGTGDTKYEAMLRKLVVEYGISEWVHFLGYVPAAEKAALLRNSKAFILTSHQENFGNAVVESLACGRPVLISRQINIWEYISDDGAAMICDDTEKSVDAMLADFMKKTPDELEQMSLLARQCYENNFRMEPMADDLIELFGSALKQP